MQVGPWKLVAAADPTMVAVPIPPLVTMLRALQDEKGGPLTEAEVLEFRDNAVCMAMEPKHAAEMMRSRGGDLDPTNVWDDWNDHLASLAHDGHGK